MGLGLQNNSFSSEEKNKIRELLDISPAFWTKIETEAYKIFENFSFKEIGSVEYGDWDGLSSIVGEEETKNLKKVYFDCEDYKETTFAILLYNNFTFVTLIRDWYKFEYYK